MIIRGIDTLEFGLDIEDYEKNIRPFLKSFKILKEEGQNEGKAYELEMNGVTITIEKSGMPFYAYRVSCKDFIVGFTDKPTNDLLEIRVRLLAGFLWSYGYREAYEKFLCWFNVFNVKVLRSRISRVDICADTDKVSFLPSDINKFVTRAKSKVKHFVSDEYKDGRRFSGFTIGRGQPLLARIYDKSNEIKRSGKFWFLDIWEENGWNGKRPVWRVEFQLRREVLKELRIDSVEDLWSKEDSLWVYLTTEWIQLRTNSQSNVSRSKEKRKWTIIRRALSKEGVSPLIREQVKKGDLRRLLDQASGLILSISAAGSYETIDQALHTIKSWEEIKLGKEGTSFESKVNERRLRFIK